MIHYEYICTISLKGFVLPILSENINKEHARL